ncbi:MAG: multicopper oxidase domain-containing protein [Candidatus Micrarchaeota archaeon]
MIDRNHAIALVALLVIGAVIVISAPQAEEDAAENVTNISSHLGTVGEYQTDDFDPEAYLKAWNFNDLPEAERAKFYRETSLSDGTMLREYWFYAEDGKIEIAPGVFYDAWTYNGQVPAPTIRATEGDTVRIYFTNNGSKPHTMHFHGFHEAAMDGSMPDQFVNPGENFTYEFKAEPFGLHLYHCHSTPLKDHISRGLYGVYIVDPKGGREPANEMIMLLNAFDTDFDGENEVYAVNTRAFYYNMHPIKVKKGELVRIYAVNIVENDPINSLHTHANFFYEYRTGTSMEPNAFTDIIELGQAERSILEMRFNNTGRYMFHAHQTEFTELGWMGMFYVEDDAGEPQPAGSHGGME